MKKNLKLVIDTNVWISYLIGKETKNLEELILDDSIEIYASAKLIEEIFIVLKRPIFSKLIPFEIKNEFFELSDNIFKIIEVTTKVNICRDPEDNFIIELCEECKADYLLTGDTDLLNIKEFRNTKIVNLKEFLAGIYKYK